MNGVEADLKIENGGGNQEAIHGIIDELWHANAPQGDKSQEIWKRVTALNCDRFYMENGAKVTRPLKTLLIDTFGKDSVTLLFAEFCKRVGNVYARVTATAELRDTYFTDDDSGTFGDNNSCFLDGGCNELNGRFIDESPSTGVITVTPEEKKYSAGRMIVWFVNPTTAHLINRYGSCSGQRELPLSIFVRALEVLTKTNISWRRESAETLPVYLNNSPVICTATQGTTFDSVVADYRFKCPACHIFYTPDTGVRSTHGTQHYMACSHSCLEDTHVEDDDSITCEDCGREGIDRDDAYVVHDNYYCRNCYEDNYFYCEHCSTDCDQGSSVTVHNARGHEETVCEDCADADYFRCNHCDGYFHNDNGITTDDGETYCEGCASDHVMTCEKCGIVSDDLDDFDEDSCCPGCHVEDEEEAVAV
jgi:hypothetical protein